MADKKRTRPAGKGSPKQPDRPVRMVMPALNAPYPGCCKPYPDATFRDQALVRVDAHHNGPRCGGYLEPMSLEDWNVQIDRRAAAARGQG